MWLAPQPLTISAPRSARFAEVAVFVSHRRGPAFDEQNDCAEAAGDPRHYRAARSVHSTKAQFRARRARLLELLDGAELTTDELWEQSRDVFPTLGQVRTLLCNMHRNGPITSTKIGTGRGAGMGCPVRWRLP